MFKIHVKCWWNCTFDVPGMGTKNESSLYSSTHIEKAGQLGLLSPKTMNSWEMSVLLGSELWEMEFFFEINSFYLEASLAWFKLPLPIKQVHSEIKVLLSNYSSLLPHMANSVHPLAYIWVLQVYTALLKKRLRCSPSQMAVKLDKNMITEHLKKCGKFLFSRLSLKRNWHAKNLKFLGAC